MEITKQHIEFNYYCLDRLKPLTEEFPVTYYDGSVVKKILYKIGLRSKIKHQDCFVLYTESDQDLEQFIYIEAESFYNNQRRFFNDILQPFEVKEYINQLKTINIFEYVSLLEFECIYDEFKCLVESNWEILSMDNLIEI